MMEVISDLNIWEYAGEDNAFVVPITKFVRKDGGAALVNEVALELTEYFPNLEKKFGYLLDANVEYPFHRTSEGNIIGIPTRKHYKSKFDEEMFSNGMWYLREYAEGYPDMLFYLIDLSDHSDIMKEALEGIENVIHIQRVRSMNIEITSETQSEEVQEV